MKFKEAAASTGGLPQSFTCNASLRLPILLNYYVLDTTYIVRPKLLL
jgi:hypothetical protein